MKKLIIVALIFGSVLGTLNFLIFSVFKEDLYNNEALLNVFIIAGMAIVVIISFFIFRRSKKKMDNEKKAKSPHLKN